MKVTIVGTGHVGSTLAYAVVLQGLAEDLLLVNRTRRTAQGHARDLQHASSFVDHPIRVRDGDISDSRDSDIVVMTLSVPMPRDRIDRLALADENLEILKQWLPAAAELSPNAVYLIVTNPVDVMTWAALQLTSLPEQRVCGVGTLVDSARFRSRMSEELRVHSDDIRAYVLGEHGNSQVAAVSAATIGGEHFDRSTAVARRLATEIVTSGPEILEAKGYTDFAVATATAKVIKAVGDDEHRTLPLSVLVDGYCGISDVCLSIPVVIGRQGVTRYLHPQLSPDEESAFQASAAQVRGVIERIRPRL